ncbi:MAG: RrF2 family transcriptional regulator [Schwartzia sp.]|nr:RrF2 family transcriptional regulator [Schwartzia sp. (in: firmicutes)]
MKISTRGRYALRLMIDIGMNDKDNPVRIKDIAQRQEISEKYLEQIVSVLNKAGYVRSSRGPQGGYRLARAPKDYTLGDILTLIEGSLAPVACLDTPVNECPREAVCPTLILWKKIDDAVHGVVDSITLEDLLKWQNQLLPEEK